MAPPYPAQDAEVWGVWSRNGNPIPSGEDPFNWGPTNAAGNTMDLLKTGWPGSYQCCVTDILKEGCVYDPPSNQAGPCQEVDVP